MIRALWFLLRAGVIVAAAIWIADMTSEGSVEIHWKQYLIETTPGVVVAAAILFALAVSLLFTFLRFVGSLPARLRRHRADVARDDGYRALTQGLLAIAAGDIKRADRMTARAQTALPDQPLTKLLTAQTALLHGNDAAANRAFAELLDDPEGAFFGVRGLLNDSLKRRDYAAARDYLLRADKLQPNRPWILRGLFDMEARTRNWLAAERLLRRLQRQKALAPESIRAQRQAVWMAQSLDLAANENLPAATRRAERLRFAQAAYRLDTDNIPAALVLSDALIAAGKLSAARKLVRRSWARMPHPQLAERWRVLMPPQKPKHAKLYAAAEAQFDWMSELAGLRPEHIESKRALGLAALEARHWRQARPLLQAANDYRALAQLEREETGDDAAARGWLEKAADAPPREQWICDACGHRDEAWQPLCPQCDSFNAFSWRHPSVQQGILPSTPTGVAPPAPDLLSPPV